MHPDKMPDREIGRWMSLGLSLRRDLSFSDERLVEQWIATAHLEDPEDEDTEYTIGHAHLVRCRRGEQRVPDILDSLGSDLGDVASAVLDLQTGEPVEEIEDNLASLGDSFLILSRVEMEREWRGRGIGRWFAAEAIESLSGGVGFVATYPAPLDDSKGTDRRKAGLKLRGVWADIGFEHFRDGVMFMDLGLVTLENGSKCSARGSGWTDGAPSCPRSDAPRHCSVLLMGDDTVADTTIADALRAWAKGVYATEAAVELLIRHGKVVYEGAPWLQRDGDVVYLDPETLRYESGVWSSGEQDIVQIALSLLGERPVDLSDVLPGLDRRNLELVLAAIAHAGGSHQHTDVRYDSSGQIVGFGREPLPPLFPWPEA